MVGDDICVHTYTYFCFVLNVYVYEHIFPYLYFQGRISVVVADRNATPAARKHLRFTMDGGWAGGGGMGGDEAPAALGLVYK